MDAELISIGLPAALGLIMFGLGLDLTLEDFARVIQRPRPVAVALVCQILLLPALCFALVLLFRLPPPLAVGMMLLAASPGGAAANLYSHLFRGDVALNISLTAVNSVIAVATLPILVNLAGVWFLPHDPGMGLQFGKTLEVFLIVLVPVGLGMAVRAQKPGFALAMDQPVRIASIALLVLVVAGAAASGFRSLAAHFLALGGIAALFCACSLAVGYVAPRLAGVDRPQAMACAFEVGIHNAALAIVVAQSVLNSPEAALPGAVYAVVMFPMAALFGWRLSQSPEKDA